MGLLNLIPGLLAAVDDVGKRIAPDKDRREDHLHAEQLAVLAAAKAEARPASVTWWDSLWDGLNRAPRPLLAFMVMGMFAYAPLDPEGFVTVMQAYQLVPEWLALLAGTVIAFYFGSRHLENRLRLTGPTPAQIALARELAARAAARVPAARVPPAPAPPADAPIPDASLPSAALPSAALSAAAAPMPDGDYARAMADAAAPLSDAAIREWNRRRRTDGP